MKVYNLTEHALDFHGVTIQPNGGYVDYPSKDGFVSNRDREMAKKGVISFEKLPFGWKPVAARVAKAVKPFIPPTKPAVKEEPKKAETKPQSFNPLEQAEKPLSTGWVEKKIGKRE
jgi:hypothetical protein